MFSLDEYQRPDNVRPWAGPAAGMGDIWSASRDYMVRAQNSDSEFVNAGEAYQRMSDRLFRETGQRIDSPFRYHRPQKGETAHDVARRVQSELASFHEKINALAASHPDEGIKVTVGDIAREAEARYGEVNSRFNGDFSSWAAWLGGSMWGAMHDPINAYTMLLGGGPSRTALGGVAKAALINATGEAAIQPFLADWRSRHGLDYTLGDAAANIGGAALFGGVFDAGMRAIARLPGAIGKARADRSFDPSYRERASEKDLQQADAALKAEPLEKRVERIERAFEANDNEALAKLVEDIDPALATDLQDLARAHAMAKIGANVEASGKLADMITGNDGVARSAGRQWLRSMLGGNEPPPVAPEPVAPAGRALDDDSLPAAQPGHVETIDNKPVSFTKFDPAEIETDASTFQFKGGGDASGVTQRLRTVETWNPTASGKAFVFEAADGQRFIADGHQRLGLARRIGDPSIRLDGYLFRESDGWTPRDVRVLAAKKNLQEGSGTTLDAAAIIREAPHIIDKSVPLNSDQMTQARHLARLSEPAWGMVKNGIAPAHQAAMIGQLVPNADLHADLVKTLASAGLNSAEEARILIGQALDAGVTKESQLTLFGLHEFQRSLLPERVKVMANSLQNLRAQKRLFGALDRHRGTIEAAGNQLDADANMTRALQAGEFGEVIELLGQRKGPVSDALNRAAARLAEGASLAKARAGFLDELSDIMDKEGLAGLVSGRSVDDAAPLPKEPIEPGSEAARAQTADIEASPEFKFALDPTRARSRTDSLAGTQIDVPAALAEWLGVEPGRFWSDYNYIAGKRDRDMNTNPLLASAEKVREYVEDVLSRADLAYRSTPAGDRWDLVALDGIEKGIGVRLEKVNGVYHVRTAIVYAKDQLARQIGTSIERNGPDAVRWRGAGTTLLPYIDEANQAGIIAPDHPSSVEIRARIARNQDEPKFSLAGDGWTIARHALDGGIIDEVDRVVGRLPESLKVRFGKGLLDVGPRSDSASGSASGNKKADAVYARKAKLIWVSLNAADPAAKLRHEEIHALRDLKLFTRKEWDTLSAKAEAMTTAERAEIETAYGPVTGKDRDAISEEAVAHMFEGFKGGRRFGGAVDRIIYEVRQGLERIGNALRLRGFHSADDVFRRIERGELGKRAKPDETGAAPARSSSATVSDRPGDLMYSLRRELEEMDAAAGEGGGLPPAGETQIKSALDEKRRRAVLTVQMARRIEQQLLGHRNAAGELDVVEGAKALLEHFGWAQHSSIGNRRKVILGELHAELGAALHDFERTFFAGRTRDPARLDMALMELSGQETGDEAARLFAEAFRRAAETARQRFNAAGGSIAKLDKWWLPQMHDRRAVEAAGREAWKQRVTPMLDAEHMVNPFRSEPGAEPVRGLSPDELSSALDHVYESIITEGRAHREPRRINQGGVGALASRHQDHRFLMFKDGERWLDYAREFGGAAGQGREDLVLHAMTGYLNGMAKEIAMMEVLGPNPTAMLTYAKQLIEKEGAARKLGQRAAMPQMDRDKSDAYVKSGIRTLDERWDALSGALDVAVDEKLAAGGQVVRDAEVASKLGSAMLSALGDTATIGLTARHGGMSWGEAANTVRMIGSYLREDGRRMATEAGFINDVAAHLLEQETRFGGSVRLATRSGWLADRTLTWSGLTAWTQAAKRAFGMETMGSFARSAGSSWDQLPAARRSLMSEYGFTAADWEVLRSVPHWQPREGARFLRSRDLLDPDNFEALTARMDALGLLDDVAEMDRPRRAGEFLRGLHTRYMEMIYSEMQYAVPEGTLAGKTFMAMGQQRGTLKGEAARLFWQFKSYPITVLYMHGGRFMRMWSRGERSRAGWYLANGLMMTTLGGMLALQLKDMKAGREPRDIKDGRTWAAAFAQGGGLGIAGDFVFSDQSRFNASLLTTLAGPAFGDASKIAGLTVGNAQKALAGKKTTVGKDAVSLLRGLSGPQGSLWYTTAAWNHLVLDTLQRMVDPDAHRAFARMEKNRRRDYAQDYWWRPGEALPFR